MNPKALKKILDAHILWLEGRDGQKADLTGADLARADLTGANLTWADLTRANLTGANLTRADLTWADLTRANLTGANLTRADLARADLTGANLTWADLTEADLDFASWPLWCGSKNPIIDERLARQLLAHAFAVAGSFCKPTKKQIKFCNGFHRIVSGEFPAIK